MTFLKTFERKWAKAILSKCALSAFFIFPLAAHAAPVILPLITYFDSGEGIAYNWWAENKTETPIAQQMAKISQVINPLLSKLNYIDPATVNLQTLPEEFHKSELSAEQKLQIAKLYKSGSVTSGSVSFSKSPVLEDGVRLKIQLQALTSGGRRGEIFRILDLSVFEVQALTSSTENPLTAVFAELSAQMSKKKFVGQQLELIVSGKLTSEDLDNVKKQLRSQVRGVRAISPKTFDNDVIALNLDYEGAGSAALSRDLKKTQWTKWRTQVVSFDGQRVFFDMKPKIKN